MIVHPYEPAPVTRPPALRHPSRGAIIARSLETREEVVLVAMAQVMSGMPDVWRRVLAEHVPDQGGRCQACRDEGGFSASWPCLTRRIAEQAKRIHDDPQPEFPPLHAVDWSPEPTPLHSTDWAPEPSPIRSTGRHAAP